MFSFFFFRQMNNNFKIANFIGIPNDDDDFEVAPTQVRKKTSQNSQSSQEKPR